MPCGHRRIGIGFAAIAAVVFAATPASAQRAPNRQAATYGDPSAERQQPAGPRQYPAPGGTSLSRRLPGVPVPRQPAGPSVERRAAPYFRLSPEDEAVVQLVLKKWEEKNAGVKTFSCSFTLSEFNNRLQLNPRQPQEPVKRTGRLSYAAPDRGMYQVDSEPEKNNGEHWVCDGKAIYEVREVPEKQIIERRLPENLKGKAIADAPLPFVFGSTAEKMEQRFWIRVSTPDRNHTQIDLRKGQVLLEALPKTQQDAANFQLVQVIFLEKDMTIFAINEFLPNHAPNNEHRLMYVFDRPSINSPLERLKNLFNKPENKLGYKLIVEPAPGEETLPLRSLPPAANSKSRSAPQGASRR